jgi:Amt family ammonium transporter
METEVESVKSFVDTLWVIDCAILVFIMQAGFMCVESGLSRHKNSINVALKNAADFGVSVVVFWLFGFGLMFGKSFNGFLEQTYFSLQQMYLNIKRILCFRQCSLQQLQLLFQEQ